MTRAAARRPVIRYGVSFDAYIGLEILAHSAAVGRGFGLGLYFAESAGPGGDGNPGGCCRPGRPAGTHSDPAADGDAGSYQHSGGYGDAGSYPYPGTDGDAYPGTDGDAYRNPGAYGYANPAADAGAGGAYPHAYADSGANPDAGAD